MNTQKIIARLRERAATQDARGSWSLDRAAADELERLSALDCPELHTFLDDASGEGLVLAGVDAGDLYCKLYPAKIAT